MPLPLPTGTRYLQFRILFDSTIESAVALDYLEFDYGEPLISGGVVAEVFPPRVALGEEASLRYFLRPFFADGEEGEFNRIELTVPDASTRIDTFKFDGRAWEEIAVPTATNADDPLLPVDPLRLEPEPDSPFVVGQFAQTIVSDPRTGETRLLVKFPLLRASDFKARQSIELSLGTRLFRGSARFAGSVWNDSLATREATIPQRVRDGDAVQEVATDATLVVVDNIQPRRLQVQAVPNPFTPNGDGINDAIEFAFDLFLVLDQIEVAVEILDLSGRRMHRVGPVSRTAGQTKLKWDGRDRGRAPASARSLPLPPASRSRSDVHRDTWRPLAGVLMTHLILAVLISTTAAYGQGYRLTANAIRVDQGEHWREWIFQNDVVRTLNERADSTGLFSLSDDGVQPRLVATLANAARDAGQFSYVDAVRTNSETVQGGATALSNDRIAARLIDGDLDTFWEPATVDFSAAGLRNWELPVDLGRLAFIDSITVSFPAGDAPKAFSLFVSLGEPFPFPDGNGLNFSLVAETKATELPPPGADGLVRQSYPIAPLLRADFNLDGQPDLRGSFLQYIRLKITESDLERHRFVGEGDAGRDAYQALPPERRGAVVHQRLTAGDFLIEIDEDTYFNDVSAAQRGPIRYFEREVPRVAEVEVWTKGDNLAPQIRESAPATPTK